MQNGKILGWNIREVKILLNMIDEKGEDSLLGVFKKFANRTKRNVFSVRNYYYKLIDNIQKNKELKTKLAKNGIKNFSTKSNHFKDFETEKLLRTILNNDKNISVRRACMDLAGGDNKLMMRYQNKYRNAINTNPQLIEKIKNDLQKDKVSVRGFHNDNIMVMPSQEPSISEKDIQNLFSGLVRLVKKSAQKDIEQSLKNEAEFANTALQNSLIDLRRKEILIKELNEQNAILKEKLKKTERNLIYSQQKMIGSITQITQLADSKNMIELKKFIQKLKVTEQYQKK